MHVYYEYVVELLVQKLNDPIVQKASFFHRVGDEVRYIQDELEMIRRSLPDAYEKQGRDERVKLWMQDVTDAVYDLEDIICRMVSKTAPHRQGGFMGSLNRCALTFNKLVVRRKVALEIERIMIKIRSISDASSAYGIQCTNWAEGTSTDGQNLRAHLIVEPDIAGSDRESYTLAGYLTEDRLELCVVILLGELGHGKTTLARRLYNEYRVKKFFNSRTWVFVSHDYDLKTLLLEIINCGMVQSDVELKAMMEKDIVELTEHIFNYLEDKRYLMVFDEIWETKAWDDLKNAFPDKNNGSRVMFVTRNKDLPSHLLTVGWTHELSSLSNADKWELFSKKASIQKQDIPESFKLFLQNSPPLAIVAVGGLLSRKERNEWENILESIQSLNEVISLGYKDLPYYLKPCFLYLGIFPENYEFHPKKLIQCWVAEGFLQQRGDHKTPEELGEEFLLELIQRGMIQVAERSSSGCIKRCCISFLVHNLSHSEAEEENFLDVFHEHSRPRQTATQHRLALHSHFNRSTDIQNFSSPHLRSLFCFKMAWLRVRLKTLKLLRVLDLEGALITEWPDGMGELIHLRYLGLRRTKLKFIPPSVRNLRNLMTLDVKFTSVDEVPDAIQEMKGLRHLYTNRNVIIRKSRIIESLINIQTIPMMQADAWMEEGLGKLTNLRKLGISGDLSFCNEALSSLSKLQSLRVAFGFGNTILDLASLPLNLVRLHLERRLEKLHQLPRNLVKLSLRWSLLEEDPLPTLERLQNLRILLLGRSSFIGKKMVCSSGGFPQLKFLKLDLLDELEDWEVNEGALPSLNHLVIQSCRRLKDHTKGLQHVTSLELLEYSRMPDEFTALFEYDGYGYGYGYRYRYGYRYGYRFPSQCYIDIK